MSFSSEMKKPVELEVLQVIKIVFTRGSGTKDDPYRDVSQYWNMKGEMIFELDVID